MEEIMISEFIGRKKIGQILIESGIITNEQLNECLEIQHETSQLIGQILIEKGYIDEIVLAKALAKQFGVQFHSLEDFSIDSQLMDFLPEDLVKMYYFIPYAISENRMTIIIHDPTNVALFDTVHLVTGLDIDYLIAPYSKVIALINDYFSIETDEKTLDEVDVDEILEDVKLEFVKDGEQQDKEQTKDLLNAADQKPIIALVNKILLEAIRETTSDIHIEAEEDMVQVRYRIDGVLYNKMPVAKKALNAIISRIKIMSNLDIAERMIPQDGAFSVLLGNKKVDFRVSILPSIHGENVVLRILSRDSINVDLKSLGFNKLQYEVFLKNIKKPYGMVITSGPTGSGKTTTLYAAMNEIKCPEVKIITVENPVEYQLAGVQQVQTFENKNDPSRSLTFASALRSILRHDPDDVLIGEIRDGETAAIAVNAALTGHMVFSTVHANNAIDVIARMQNLGVERYLLCGALNLVIAQRLIRRLCDCKEPVEVSPNRIKSLGFDYEKYSDTVFYKPVGCEKCSGRGYKGRVAIFEMLNVSTEIREMILTGQNIYEMLRVAKKQGFSTLLESAFEKAVEGITSLDEVDQFVIE
jgi:type IV pilus assembly protein PilB